MSRPVVLTTFAALAFFTDAVRFSTGGLHAPQTATQVQDSQAERLLVDSYLSGMNLAPQEHAFLLVTLSSAAAKIQPSLCKLWSKELFKLSFKLPMNWNRVAYEKNALVALAAVDPIGAFELFGQIDTPIPTPSGDLPEDLRADAANTVFVQYWKSKGPAGLEQLRSEAAHLGDTGQYPYMAMAAILVDVSKTNDNSHLAASALFGDALAYYGRGSSFGTEDYDFIAFLEEVWDLVSHNLRQQGLELAVKRLVQKSKPREGEVFSGQVSSKSGVAQFESEAQQELYELLPRIREINPKWAQTLVEEHPFLAQTEAGTNKASSSGAAVIYSGSEAQSGQLAALRGQASQLAQFSAAMAAASSNPDEALRVANALDLGQKSQVHAQIAATLAVEQADRASKLMQQTERSLDSIADQVVKFKVLVNLGSAAAALQDSKTFHDIFGRGISLGVELFAEDMQAHPGKLAYQTATFPGLGRLIQLGIGVDAKLTVPRIERIEDDALRANLLAVAAEALHDQQDKGSAIRNPQGAR